MDDLSERHLGHRPIAFKDVAGSGKSQLSFDQVAIAKATEYAAEDADVTLRLWRVLKPRLAADRMTTVYETLERPLVPVLAAMERDGIKVDRRRCPDSPAASHRKWRPSKPRSTNSLANVSI